MAINRPSDTGDAARLLREVTGRRAICRVRTAHGTIYPVPLARSSRRRMHVREVYRVEGHFSLDERLGVE